MTCLPIRYASFYRVKTTGRFNRVAGNIANLTQAGKGRPPGVANKLTRDRREFLEMIAGAQGSEERKQLAAKIRERFLAGELSPAVELLIAQWLLGIPKETVEVQFAKPSQEQLEELTPQQLAERARTIAMRLESGEYVPALSEGASERTTDDLNTH